MGGGSSSKSKTDIFSELVNKAFVKTLQSCQTSVNQVQEIVIHGSNNTVSNVQMKQQFSGMMKCVQDNQFIADFQAKLANDIKSAAASQSVSVLGALGNSNSEIDTRLRQSVQNIVDTTNMTKLVTTMASTQRIQIGSEGAVNSSDNNVVENITLEQFNEMLSSNSQKIINQISAVNDLKAQIDQESKATQTNFIKGILDGVANIVGEITGPFLIGMILLAVAAIAWFLFGGSELEITEVLKAEESEGSDEYSEE